MATPIKSGAEIRVNTKSVGIQSDSYVTGLAGGRFVVSWTDSNPGAQGKNIRSQLFNADGSKFGGEGLVNTDTAGNQTESALTRLAGGGYMAVWKDPNVPNVPPSGIKAQLYSATGVKQGGEIQVNTHVGGVQGDADVTTLSDGRLIVVWKAGNSDPNNPTKLMAQQFSASGSKLGGEFRLDGLPSDGPYEPVVSALAGGKFVVTWRDSSTSPAPGSFGDVSGQVYNANGSRSGAEFRVNTVVAGEQLDPAITTLSNGRFVITYWTAVGDSEIRMQMFNANGSKFGGEIDVHSNQTGQPVQSPAIAALSGGRFVVAWAETDSDFDVLLRDHQGFSIRAQMFNANGTRNGDEFLVNTTTLGHQGEPRIDVLADGRFVVTWTDPAFSTTTGEIRAQIFDPREAAIVLNGTASSDDFVGTRFNDILRGANGADRLNGAAGNDALVGGAGADRLIGGLGNDTYILGADTTDVISDTGGIDTIQSTITRVLGAGSAIENVTLLGVAAINATGNAAANTLVGNARNNILLGGGGNDILNGGAAGTDSLRGGTGDDTYVLGARTTGITIVETSGIDTIASSVTRSLAGFPAIENLTLLGVGNINGIGNGLANTLTGNAGNNILDGGAGNDTLIAGLGIDTLRGGIGGDTYSLGAELNDLVQEAVGFGTDTITSTITRSLANFANIENLTLLGTASVAANGNDFDNTLIGNSGNNIFYGAAGRDTMTGGDGDDTFAFSFLVDTAAGTPDRITDFSVGDHFDFSVFENQVGFLLNFIGTNAFSAAGNDNFEVRYSVIAGGVRLEINPDTGSAIAAVEVFGVSSLAATDFLHNV